MEEEKIASEEITEVGAVGVGENDTPPAEEGIGILIDNPIEEVITEMPPMENLEEPYGRELSREELDQLTAEQVQRYSICHPDRCPNAGLPMPHRPHTPLYPTDWC